MKELIGIIGTGFLMAGFAPYLYALWKKTARPHAFSWLLWGLISAIVCAVQVSENAGPGAWTAGIAALFNLGIGLYAIKHGEKNVTKSDWAIFVTVLAAIPLWAVTKDALWSVILVCIIDTLAFIPTIRKSWHRPHEEVASTFVLGFVGFALGMLALENPSFTNICYPVKVLCTNSIFIACLMYRRHVVSQRELCVAAAE